jgi:drug/metabolite transporter (DMT)-like permease
MASSADKRQGAADSATVLHPQTIRKMTIQNQPGAAPRVAPAGLLFLAITSICWGLNWPITKYVLSEWPPLPARGLTGIAGGLTLAAYALLRGQSLRVPPDQRGRVLISAFLNVTLWMAVMGLALLWLPASEAAVIAYTMPVWTALLAWPLLGERMTWLRVLALVMAFGGIAALMGGDGFAASFAKLPGILLALIGAVGFALGTIFLKRFPIALPGATSAAWQIGLGCLPVAIIGLVFEQPSFAALSARGMGVPRLHDIHPVLRRLCLLVCSAGKIASLCGHDRHHGGSRDRRGRIRKRAARTTRRRADSGIAVDADRCVAGDAILGRKDLRNESSGYRCGWKSRQNIGHGTKAKA